MDASGIVSLIRQRRDEWRESSFIAQPGETDQGILEMARRAAEFAEEYDALLTAIAMDGAIVDR